MRILIVDDSDANRMLLHRMLETSGFENVIQCKSAEDAFETLSLGETDVPASPIDLILLDIRMPGIDGIAACRQIKEDIRYKDTPIIMVTAMDDSKSLQSAFEAGAMDYLNKPINRTELKARVGSALALKKETDRRKTREKEISEIGHSIQKELLSGRLPDNLMGIRVASLSIPSQRIDGDFYDFYRHSDRCLDVLIAHVMGKGIPAALLGAAAKSQVFRALTHLLMDSKPGDLPPCEDIVKSVHQRMSGELFRLGSYITLSYSRIDLDHNRLTWVDCGHARPFICSPGVSSSRPFKVLNAPLGSDESEVYREESQSIYPGDVLVFSSAGVTDAKNPSGTPFGEERLNEFVQENHHLNPELLLRRLHDQVAAFTHTRNFSGDLTSLVVKIEKS